MGNAPIFRWAGSKRKLLSILTANVAPSYHTYIEPFAGSACLFFALQPGKAILGDFNPHLIHAYRTIAKHPKLVHEAAARFPISSEEYYRLRSLNPSALPSVDRAARFLYLNRYCFNGVYRTNRSGQFNVPRGRDTGGIPSLAALVTGAVALRTATLVAGDFRTVLERIESNDFVYLDPPYAKADERYSGEYGYGAFSSVDFSSLSSQLDVIDRKGAKFLLSYRYSRQLRKELTKWNSSIVSVRRHVAGFNYHRATVRELLVSNMPLKRVAVAR
jgi:DNA adenine methylase